jgi:hypothetical protein
MTDLIPLLQLILSAASLIIVVITNFRVELVHQQTNSMKDQLVKEVRNAAYEAGLKAQKATDDKQMDITPKRS